MPPLQDPTPFVYLASRSPRRRELLMQMGVSFSPLPFRSSARADDDIDETPHPGEAPLAYVQRVAQAKAVHGWRMLIWRGLAQHPVLSADTTLEFEGDIIGKPQDAEDAARILRRLSGKTHRVLTAVTLCQATRTETALSVSKVRFAPLSEDDIQHYVESGEPMDKAGAYGIQGRA